MIAPTRPETSTDAPGVDLERRIGLPSFGRLVSASCWACAPAVAFLMLSRHLWLTLSVLMGLALSVTVCGMLYLFVARGMDYFVAGVRGGVREKNGSVGQFVLLLPAKFVVVGLLGWALLTLHSINYVAVLVGFGLAQTAIAATAARHFTKR